MGAQETLVMKFGGASVATPDHFSRIARIILEKKQSFSRIAVVVSAMGDTTDQLISLAKAVHASPPQREYDMLVAVGERVSSSLLAMALDCVGCDARSFTGSQCGIITDGRHTQARIIEVRPQRILPHLEAGRIVIVAGFQGVSKEGEITTLGRGGSDTSAVALAIQLEAKQVEFYKDVPGVFCSDPYENPKAQFYDFLTYEELLEILNKSSGVLHPRAVQLAQLNHVPLLVRSFKEDVQLEGTWVGLKERGEIKEKIFETEKESSVYL